MIVIVNVVGYFLFKMLNTVENGFQTAVVYDATATISEKDFEAAVTNYQAFSSATWSTQQAISQL